MSIPSRPPIVGWWHLCGAALALAACSEAPLVPAVDLILLPPIGAAAAGAPETPDFPPPEPEDATRENARDPAATAATVIDPAPGSAPSTGEPGTAKGPDAGLDAELAVDAEPGAESEPDADSSAAVEDDAEAASAGPVAAATKDPAAAPGGAAALTATAAPAVPAAPFAAAATVAAAPALATSSHRIVEGPSFSYEVWADWRELDPAALGVPTLLTAQRDVAPVDGFVTNVTVASEPFVGDGAAYGQSHVLAMLEAGALREVWPVTYGPFVMLDVEAVWPNLGGVPYLTLQRYAADGSSGHVITCAAAATAWEAERPTCEALIESFTLE